MQVDIHMLKQNVMFEMLCIFLSILVFGIAVSCHTGIR
jgi:hypothetical protein